jgi:plasmid maintenance system killer protein
MATLPGRRLGPYEILSAIGAGGMGEGCRVRDTRLERIVAIKVLPTHLAERSELRERFEREARTIASLNHPHICTLHDIGHQDGIDYLLMEYLEGEREALRTLDMLDAAPDLGTLAAIPGNCPERLHRDREDQHSIRINNRWRICFDWKDGDAYQVEITDYH